MAGGGVNQAQNTGGFGGYGGYSTPFSGGFSSFNQNQMQPSMQPPMNSMLPVFTQSDQARAVYDPNPVNPMMFNKGRDLRNFGKQQDFISNPYQQMYSQSDIDRMYRPGHSPKMQMPNNMAFTPIEYDISSRRRNDTGTMYQASPMGIPGLLV
jgi:hypothetical protein